LWEERFKCVIVESGIAARTMAAYIDLKPVRLGMVSDPADYRWSSYGEAVGGGSKGNGKKAREGLVRVFLTHKGVGYDSGKWHVAAHGYRSMLGMALDRKSGNAEVKNRNVAKTKNSREALESAENETVLKEQGIARMRRCRVRCFTDGAVIGSRMFVDEAFQQARSRFGSKRKDGARRMKGNASPAAGLLWSLRDLRTEII
jgi:putative transposase